MSEVLNPVFFLGGHDLEMVVIKRMVQRTLGPGHVVDKGLDWGAAAQSYATEIDAAIAAGRTPVLIELHMYEADKARWPEALLVDHHGPRAGEATSLEQVYRLLGAAAPRWRRWHRLVAVNDRGHVRAMRAAGASLLEMRRVRAADRCAQGITPAEDAAGAAALAAAETRFGGRLLLVRLPHGRTATVADRLALTECTAAGETEVPATLLVVSPGEVNVFGPGKVIEALANAFPEGWWGGDLPAAGFWGISTEPLPEVAILSKLERALA